MDRERCDTKKTIARMMENGATEDGMAMERRRLPMEIPTWGNIGMIKGECTEIGFLLS